MVDPLRRSPEYRICGHANFGLQSLGLIEKISYSVVKSSAPSTSSKPVLKPVYCPVSNVQSTFRFGALAALI